MADEFGPSRLWRPELLRSMEAKGFKQILAKTKDSSHGRYITYFIADTDLLLLTIAQQGEKLYIPSWIPLRKLHKLSVSNVEELWSSFQLQLQTNAQACFELRVLYILDSPSLQKLPDLIEMFSHLEELYIFNSLEKTDATSLVQSLKQLCNLRSLGLGLTEEGGFFRGNLDMSKGRDSTNLDSSTRNRMDSLETIELESLQNISKLVISGEMCPRLQTLKVKSMKNLMEIELKQLERLTTLLWINVGNWTQFQGCLL